MEHARVPYEVTLRRPQRAGLSALFAQLLNRLQLGDRSGECDQLPEQAFYMVGLIEEAFEKAKTLQ